MQIDLHTLKKILISPGHVSEVDFDLAVREAEGDILKMEDLLIEKNIIKDEQLGHLVAQEINFPYVNLTKEKIEEKILNSIPEVVARARKVIAYSESADSVKVAMNDPNDMEMCHILEKKYNKNIVINYATLRDIDRAMLSYKASLKEEFFSALERFEDPEISREDKNNLITEIFDLILKYAFYSKSSDIHFEPRRRGFIVRFRIDGVMHEVIKTEADLLNQFLSKIKIMAKLRIDEHRAAQDGKIYFEIDGRHVDIRVSIVPVTHGENAVMRLLSSDSRKAGLDDLGFSEADLAKINKAIKNPHGMILSVGPTGSGKTTTIYELLKKLNSDSVHIASIEDPVEYDIDGVSQIQVNTKTNLTFANGLRAIVRQDPNIIMVGEIRDIETAGIAVNSAMTGHLVLSTLHSNDAATTLPRLLDMEVEAYLVSSTIRIIIAQRLVRKICPKCVSSYELASEEINTIKSDKFLLAAFEKHGKDLSKIRLFKGSGCKVCAQTGYGDRIGIFEVLEMNDLIKELIMKRANSAQIEEIARQSGMTSLLEDGVEKAFYGKTTLSEVLRVTIGGL